MQRMPETIIVYYEKSQSYIIAQTYGCPLSDIHYLHPFFLFLSSSNRQLQLRARTTVWTSEINIGHMGFY